VKEKSAMEENFFDFTKTKEALSQLSADLAVLDSEIQSKVTAFAEERKQNSQALIEKDSQLEILRGNIAKATRSIDSITAYIDGVL